MTPGAKDGQKPGIDVPGIPQHVIQRGVNRCACFRDQLDREFYLASIGEIAAQYEGIPMDDPIQRQPDITLAKEVLYWQPQISLEQGLERTIQYFDATLSKSLWAEAAE